MRVVSTLAGLLVVVAVGGCIFVTGGTDGYTGPEGGTGLACESPGACGDAGRCCVVINDAGVPSSSCQASCHASSEQMCDKASECGEGGSCLTQTCTIEGMTGPVATCGPISSCTQ